MTLDYLPQEMIVNTQEMIGDYESSSVETSISGPSRRRPRISRMYAIVEDKLRIPEIGGCVRRPRLTELLERTKERAGVTLVCGRSGTGKTVLGADFAANYLDPVWYSIEPADTDWRTFANYLAAALCGSSAVDELCESESDGHIGPAKIAEFISRCMQRRERSEAGRPRLLVLDNLHHLYDSAWFPDFFNQLILSNTAGVHVLMLSRTKPPVPLWRLRSKQMLNVIDENVLGFTPTETVRLCDRFGVSSDSVAQAHLRSSGRISKLIAALQETEGVDGKGWAIV